MRTGSETVDDEDRATEEALRDKREKGRRSSGPGPFRASLAFRARASVTELRLGPPVGDEDRATEEALRDKRDKGEKVLGPGPFRASLAFRAAGVGDMREAECRDDD